MCDYTFMQIKEAILNWSLKDILNKLSKNDILEITKNEEDVLMVDLTFQYCLAQIVVARPTFAPYQFVTFEAMTLDSENALETGVPDFVYFFYDSKETTKNKVLEILTYGVKFCSQYIPEELGLKYIGKRGTVSITKEELIYIVHPDDINKSNFDLVDEEFVCIGTEAQYLLVNNTMNSLRILPNCFIANS